MKNLQSLFVLLGIISYNSSGVPGSELTGRGRRGAGSEIFGKRHSNNI